MLTDAQIGISLIIAAASTLGGFGLFAGLVIWVNERSMKQYLKEVQSKQ